MPLLVVCTVNARFPLNMGLTMSVVTIHGSPCKTFDVDKQCFPFFLLAETLNAPSVRKPEKQTSFKRPAVQEKYGFPPQLCINISCIHCAPDSGVSITRPLSLYMVVELKELAK